MTRRRVLLVGALVSAIAAVLSGAAEDKPKLPRFGVPKLSGAAFAHVARAESGDTLIARSGSELLKLRLLGVQAPTAPGTGRAAERYGDVAAEFLDNLVRGEDVYLVFDPKHPGTDDRGRRPAYVYRSPDALFVNAEVLRQGYGRAETSRPMRFAKEFQQLERWARAAKKGLWDPARRPLRIVRRTTSRPARPPAESQPVDTAAKPEEDEEPQEDEEPVLKPVKDTPGMPIHHVVGYYTPGQEYYHRPGCPRLGKRKVPIPYKMARERGLLPCPYCKPPG